MTNTQTWPLNIDFTIAVQNPHLCFADHDLKNASTAKNSRGRVLLWSGNFATVYKLTTEDRSWAVRCFTRTPQADVQRRYKLISEHLSQHSIPYLVNFEFIAQGVLVKGEWYPILKMDWVDGEEIDRYIGENIDEPQVLLRLDRQLKQLQQDLQLANIAHGDLQHGNIMVDDQGELKLVDYDGMYVPKLQGSPPIEIGHPNYQPPDRSLEDFGDRLDEFSFDVISLSLRALAVKPELWDTFHEDNKNLLFLQHDFQDPKSSPVFQAIADIPDVEIRQLSDRVIRKCYDKNYSDKPIQPILNTKLDAKTRAKDLTQNIEQNFKEQTRFAHSHKILLLISSVGLLIVAIIGASSGWLTPQPKPLVKQPEPTNSPPPPTPQPSNPPIAQTTPQLNRITVATLQARYAEGQRDFRASQITGNQGDRLTGQNFRDINLSGSTIERIDLRQVNFQNANLNGVSMVRVDLRGADLSGAKLIDANLTASNLSEANLTQANLLRADLTQAKLGAANLANAELMKATFKEADLNAVNFSGANLLLADLSKTNLTKANLSQSNLSAANLSDANLEGTDLTSANLRSAMLNRTNLSSANLSNANLTAASLVLVELASANLEGANFRSATIENIGSIESADFTNLVNLDPSIRKSFCSLASGQVAITGSPTKSTLNCL